MFDGFFATTKLVHFLAKKMILQQFLPKISSLSRQKDDFTTILSKNSSFSHQKEGEFAAFLTKNKNLQQF